MRVPLSIDGAPPEMYAITLADESIAEFVTHAEINTATGVVLLRMPSGNTVTLHATVEED
jgi:hypothetical protein